MELVVSEANLVRTDTERRGFEHNSTDLPRRDLADEAGVRLHHAPLASHLVLAQRHDPPQHGAGDGLIEDLLDAAEGDDQAVLDDGATPLGHARVVEMRSILLNFPARQTSLPAHLRLLDGDALVLLLVGVVGRGVRAEDHLESARKGAREAHHDGAGELVRDAVLVCGIGSDGDDVPRLLADVRGQSLVHVIFLLLIRNLSVDRTGWRRHKMRFRSSGRAAKSHLVLNLSACQSTLEVSTSTKCTIL